MYGRQKNRLFGQSCWGQITEPFPGLVVFRNYWNTLPIPSFFMDDVIVAILPRKGTEPMYSIVINGIH